jgi:hypothetical protein
MTQQQINKIMDRIMLELVVILFPIVTLMFFAGLYV